MAHLDRRRGFGIGGGRGVFGRGGSSLHLIYFNGAQLPFRVADGRSEKKHPVDVSIAKR